MSIKIKNANNEWVVDQRALDTSIVDLNNNFESTNVEGALRELFDKASKTDTETENSLKELSEKVKKKIDTVEIDEETNELKFYADGTLVKVIEIPNTIRAMCGEFFCGDVPVGYNVSPLADGDVIEGDFWVDYVTPVNAENMNRIERRLNTLDEEVEELVNAVPPPEISSSFPTDYVCTSDEEIIIDYFFTSHTPGNGTAFINIDGAESEQTIAQGSNRIVVGTLQKGEHVIKVYIKDAKGRFTPELYFNIVSGALEITTEFDLERVYSIADNIIIEYTISSVEVEGLMVKQNHNGEEVTIKGIVGKNTWELGQLEIGTHRIKIQANTATLQSNLIEFTIIVGNSSTLFVSSEFNGDNIDVTKRVVLDYRVSMVGISSFTARMYKSNNTNPDISGDTLVNTASASLGVNYWDMGMLEIGDNQIYKIQCSAKGDTVFSNILVVVINVVSQDYVPYRPVTRGCVANFDAVRSANSNTSANRHIWQDLSGVNTICELKGFNYSSNGWLDGVLRFGGDAYAEINLQPFKENITNGFTFDILYKVNNVGDIEARVCDCKEDLDGVLVTGFTINTYKAEIATSRRSIKVDHSEDVWTRMTFVVDRQNRFMQVYVNAVLTKTAIIDSDEPFITEKKIILGARVNDSKGDIINTATCDIQSVRIYNTALTHQEVLQNHISDIHDRDAQMAKRNLNSEQGVMPTMDFYLDLPLDDKGNPISLHHIKSGERVPLRIKFYDPNDIDRSFDIPNCQVQLQGTSSLAYEVKNFKIRLFDEKGKKLNLSPKEGWLPESVYTLKANYMDSSHTHNVGLAKFVNNFYDPLPPNEINPMTKKAIDGFPMLLYINGELQGIYDFNLDKGADNNFGFKDYDKVYKYGDCIRSYEISANSDIGAGAFVDDSWASICSEFEVRYHPDEDYVIDADEIMLEYMIDDDGNLALDENGNPIKAHPELQRLITWVKNCTVKSFREEAHEYLSIRHCIDYYLLVYTIGAVDNFGKNLMINTWDGKIWYPCFYDMD